jgi:predicted oxidoreductase
MVEAPFCALGPLTTVLVFTDGGLAIDTELRVLGANDRPIPGLYAAGSVGQGGMLLDGHGHHIGWAFTSGRIAGRHACAFAGQGR